MKLETIAIASSSAKSAKFKKKFKIHFTLKSLTLYYLFIF